jgi:Protein kinase domain/Inner membrane component of T3SS, cytoplasmic domain
VAQRIDVGSVIGRYRITGLVGQGGMGVVYLALDPASSEQVALKVLSAELAANEEFRTRFVREARYAGTLPHPNIVPVRDVGETEGLLYIAMPYVHGTDLRSLLTAERRLDPDRTLSILTPVASALDALHEHGVYHRDVKPGNVLIASGEGTEAAGHCYITDFGLSKSPTRDSRPLTALGYLVGTSDYAAPERVLGEEGDHRMDVYSLGCVLYECLTGATPFPGTDEVEILRKHVEEAPPRVSTHRPDVPVELDGVVARAMAKQPAERYASCGELLQAAAAAMGRPAVAPAAATEDGRAAAPRLRLRVVEGAAAGTDIAVEEELPIGRHAAGEGTLGADPELSRDHARIYRGAEGWLIEDKGSTNGTFVNDRRIAEPAPLAAGDRIQVGTTTMEVQVSPRPQPAAAPEEAGPPPLSLRLWFEGASEALLELEEGGERVKLVYADGRWRLAAGSGG